MSGVYFAYFALVGVLVPFLSLYLQALGYSGYDIGLLTATLMVTRILAPNIWGWLSDRRGRRMAWIRIGNLAALVSFLGIFVSTEFYWLMWVLFSFSFFWNAVLPQFEVVTIAHLAPRTGRYSLVRQWGSLGFFIAVVCLGYWFEGDRILSLPVIAAACLVVLWLSSLYVPEAPQSLDTAGARSIRGRVGQPAIILFLVIAFLLQVSHGPYYTFFSMYLASAGYSAATIGWLWALGVVAEIVLFWCMHRLMARTSLVTLLLWGVGLTALRWALIAVFVSQIEVLIFAQLLHAASFGLTHALAIEWIRREFQGADGQGQALYSSVCFGAGGALGAWLSGLLWGYAPAATFAMAAAMAFAAFLLCFLLYKLRT
nr:MFS transporter [Simiduia aestuariiviva]